MGRGLRRTHLFLLASAVMSTGAACGLVAGLDDLEFAPQAASAASGGGSVASSSGQGAEAGAATGGGGAGGDGGGNPVSPYAAAVLADRPLAYYRFDDVGTVAADETGRYDGSYFGSVTHDGEGAIHREDSLAAVFDGSPGAVILPVAFDFAPDQPFSIEAWVRSTAFSGNQVVFSKEFFDPVREGYLVLLYPDGRAGFERWNTTGNDASSAKPLTPNEYHHIVVTYATGSMTLYVDGAVAGSTPTRLQMVADDFPAVLGTQSDITEYWFMGSIDEVAVYDYPLALDRIEVHHQTALR
jgi:hypothetical protein